MGKKYQKGTGSMKDNRALCVYAHYKPGEAEPFYIGLGYVRRAYEFNNRSVHWKRIAAKYGVDVHILSTYSSRDEAAVEERRLITLWGRKDLGKGNLINYTDGGDGKHLGVWNYTETWKRKQALLNWGKDKRPNGASTDPWEAKLGQSLTSYTRPHCPAYDPEFEKEIKQKYPEWKWNSRGGRYTKSTPRLEVEKALLEWDNHNRPRQSIYRSKYEQRLANCLSMYKSDRHASRNPEFMKILVKVKPLWFTEEEKKHYVQ